MDPVQPPYSPKRNVRHHQDRYRWAIDHPTWRVTKRTGIVKAWEIKQNTSAFQIHPYTTRMTRSQAPQPMNQRQFQTVRESESWFVNEKKKRKEEEIK